MSADDLKRLVIHRELGVDRGQAVRAGVTSLAVGPWNLRINSDPKIARVSDRLAKWVDEVELAHPVNPATIDFDQYDKIRLLIVNQVDHALVVAVRGQHVLCQ